MKRVLLALLLMPLFTNAQDTTGMVAHWAMNGATTDASGHGHNGTGYNVTMTTGQYGKANTAYLFNGTNSMISVPYAPAFNLGKVSICGVIKVNGFNSGFCHGNMIFSRGTPSYSTTTGNYNLRFSDAGWDPCSTLDTTKETFYMHAGNNSVAATTLQYTPTITENQWYRVVAIFDSVNYKIYVNGVLKSTVLTGGSPIGSNSDSIVMGYDTWEASASYPYPFNGAMDDMKLFGRVLSDTEIVHYGDTCGRVNLQPVSVVKGIGSTVTYTIGSNLYPSPGYQWQQNSGSGFVNLSNTTPYSGVNTATLTITGITAAMSGYQYRCIVGNTWGCIDTSQGAQLTATTGVNNVVYNSPLVTVYPNPAKNNITIELPGSEGATVQIINAIGQVVVERFFTGNATRMDVSNLAAGVYIVRVKYQDYVITKKLLKE